jgi:hypothetical protein
MKKRKMFDDICEDYEDAGPLLVKRVIKFFKALGLKKAKKRVLRVDVRASETAPPLKDGGLNAARILRIEVKNISSQKFMKIMNQWRHFEDDEELTKTDGIRVRDDEDAFVTGVTNGDLDALYGLDNGGFLAVVHETEEDDPNLTIILYKNYKAACYDYPSRVLDSVLALC